MTLRIGLIGAGRIGQVHGDTIAAHPGSQLVAVFDMVEAAAVALADKHAADVANIDAILSDDGIDAIVIASPTDTHVELIEAGVKAGKAVFCEKPIDLDLARAVSCLDRVEGKPVMMGFNRRFDVNFGTLRTAFQAGEIGKGELLSITSFDPAPPPVSYIKVSGGIFRDMMIHDFDLACWIFGALPQTVYATGSCLVDAEIGAAGDIDTAVVTLTYADGRVAVIKNSRRAAYGYDQRIELLGSGGLLSAQNMLENTVVKADATGVTSARPEHFFLERYAHAYRSEWDQFLTAIRGEAPLPVTVGDGVNALALAEAATISHRTGAPVALSDVYPRHG